MRFDYKKFSQLWYLLDNLNIFDLRQYLYYFKELKQVYILCQ